MFFALTLAGFIWVGVVQPENSSISFKPDKTELLRLHTLAKADAIANTNTSSMACVRSPFHLVPADELQAMLGRVLPRSAGDAPDWAALQEAVEAASALRVDAASTHPSSSTLPR